MRAMAVFLLLGGCALAGTTSDVVPVGGDTYTVAATKSEITGGTTAARLNATKKANAYCSARDRQAKVVGVEPVGISSTVTFQCLGPDDPRMDAPMAPALTVNVNRGI